MGLDISVFGENLDDELDGFRIGSSNDFEDFRRTVSAQLDRPRRRTRFPLLMGVDVWDGVWRARDAIGLEKELSLIAVEFAKLPHEIQSASWHPGVREELGLVPTSLLESFINVDGDMLVLRLIEFAQIAQRLNGQIRLH